MSKKVTALSAEMKRRKLREAYEWVPQREDGSFWSLHKKGTGTIPHRDYQGYIGWVERAYSGKPPGLVDVYKHLNMREAAKRVESWVKE